MEHGARIEKDALGEVRVPADRLWGAQTQRSIDNFPIGVQRYRWGRTVVRAFGLVKLAASRANVALGVLPADKGVLIERAAHEVVEGRHDAEFPLVVFQTGSGTQSNMNANEVIANRAIQLAGGVIGSKQPIHPNDDVNASQSSNDVFPTVMHVALVESIDDRLVPAVADLARTLRAKAREHADVVMLGRTHLMDATPVTLGQVLGGWASQLDDALRGVETARDALHAIALGGTAVGTGLNAPAGYAETVAAELARLTGRPFATARDKFAALSAHDAVVQASAAVRTLAGAAMKIANDVRWHASGPRAGLGELSIPDNEPGSSIMPGKVNPTQCEALSMVAARVFGNDATVAFAGTQGNFQLNVYKPVMLDAALDSVVLLADALASFDIRCARGIEPDVERIGEHVAGSLMLVTALNRHIGYENAAKIAQRAHRDGTTLRAAALATGLVSAEDFDRWVDPAAMT
ncbi:MAG: class II fumarate hydratase [Burkholderiales bacterium]|nr:class II fumarate hydratase [Burkholderiales bacterium]